jgi:hypothetical protein
MKVKWTRFTVVIKLVSLLDIPDGNEAIALSLERSTCCLECFAIVISEEIAPQAFAIIDRPSRNTPSIVSRLNVTMKDSSCIFCDEHYAISRPQLPGFQVRFEVPFWPAILSY